MTSKFRVYKSEKAIPVTDKGVSGTQINLEIQVAEAIREVPLNHRWWQPFSSTVFPFTVFLLLVMLSGCAHGKPEIIKIGVIASTTGPAAFIGEPQVKGAALAIKELNSAGHSFELIVEDSPCDPQKAVTAFAKLANVDDVDYVIGPSCSFENMAVEPLAEEYGIPTIALGAQEELATAGNFTIPFNQNPSVQGEILGAYLLDKEYATGGSIYFASAYTQQIAQGLKKSFEAHNGKYVLDEELTDFSITDFKDVIAKAIGKNVEGLYIEPFGQEITVIRKASELGYHGKIVFGENGFRPEIAQVPEAEGLVLVAYQDLSGGNYDKFKEKFVQEYGKEPGQPFGAAMAYDAVYTIADSLAVDKAQLKEHIMSKEHVGSSGRLTYENQQPIRDFSLYEVKNGSFVKVK